MLARAAPSPPSPSRVTATLAGAHCLTRAAAAVVPQDAWRAAVHAAAAAAGAVEPVDLATSVILSFADAAAAEAVQTMLPASTRIRRLLDADGRVQTTLPRSNQQRLAVILNHVRSTATLDDNVKAMVDAVSTEELRGFLDYLTGITSPIRTRQSQSTGAVSAANWLQQQFESYGFKVTQLPFQRTYSNNVLAELRGTTNPDSLVIIGAHYDSRGAQVSNPTAPAPGANDDGSGTAMLLQLAKIMYDQGITFNYTLIIGAWSGEEQGLVGSRFYARKLKAEGADVVAMLQGDMLAFRRSGEDIQAGFPTRYASEVLTDLAMEVTGKYVPKLRTCYTPACCSDHQSFWEQGYAATQYFERCGPIADNRYHNAGDVVDRPGYDIPEQLASLTKAMIATIATIGGVNKVPS